MRFSILGLIQYLMRSEIPASAMDQRDPRARPEQFQRRDGRGILRAHYNHVVVVIRMRLFVVMHYFVQFFARNVQHVGQIVIAGG